MEKDIKVFMKTYADCLLYRKYPQYNAILLSAILKGERIDKADKAFEDVVYDIKRSKTDKTIMQVLMSDNTILLFPPKPLPKPFKVFCAKDPKHGKAIKVFIDCTSALSRGDNESTFRVSEAVLLSYLVNAKVAMFYNKLPLRVTNDINVRQLGSMCFALLFTHIIDYIAKITIIEGAKDKCVYLAARYYLENILKLQDVDTIRAIARKLSGISEMRENTYDFIIQKASQESNPFTDIKRFVELIKDQFKIEKLTLDIVTEKWMYLYGPGTPFALEFLPALSAMLTDAYCGGYINNQKTIENICGKTMIEYAKKIIYEFGW